MNELPTPSAPQKSDRAIIITVIIATALVLMTCIAGFSTPLIIAAWRLF